MPKRSPNYDLCKSVAWDVSLKSVVLDRAFKLLRARSFNLKKSGEVENIISNIRICDRFLFCVVCSMLGL